MTYIVPPSEYNTGAKDYSRNEMSVDQAKIILKTFGLGQVKTLVYKAGMPSPIQADTPKGPMGPLGNYVFSNLEIVGGSYTDNETGDTMTYPPLTINTILFNVNRTKNIITTPIQGRDSVVKEYISNGDFDINITGILTSNQNGVFPEDDFTALIQILKAPVALEVNSWYLNSLGIFNIVVSSFSLPQESGSYSQVPFSLSCLSDPPVELKIIR